MKRLIEIRAAEGGEDSKLFVKDLANAYVRLIQKVGWIVLQEKELPGFYEILVEGKDLSKLNYETGGHRIQRVPPTEKKGRVHTSTVTVAITNPNKPSFKLDENDLRIEWFSGTGKGGQHRNKHQNSCRLIYMPTNLVVTAQCRSRQNSYDEAYSELKKRLEQEFNEKYDNKTAEIRKNQVGSGQRGDKIRTYRFQDDNVQDHNSGKSALCSKVMKGNIDLLWK